MATGACSLYVLFALAKLVVVTLTTLWPLQWHVEALLRLRIIRAVYTVPNSNLDVFGLTLLHSIILAVALTRGAATRRRGLFGARILPNYEALLRTIRFSSVFFRLALMAKSVAVAVLGSDGLFPSRSTWSGTHAGLLCIFASIGSGLLFSLLEQLAAVSFLKGRRDGRDGAAAPQPSRAEPLLGDGADKPDASATPEPSASTVYALLKLVAPDAGLLVLAFTAGAFSALGQALIPYYTGQIVDAASIDPSPRKFRSTTVALLVVAAGCAVATGLRAFLFTQTMIRLKVRLRTVLFASLMRQELGFFDVTRTGDITSRLATDTTTVSDQVCLNLNIMLRSATQAAMVLAFMLGASWRLTVVTSMLVPLVLSVSKVYGAWYRRISTHVQTTLAEANSVAEEALSTMVTVKAHAAEESTKIAYAARLAAFYKLQVRSSVAYAAYMTVNTFSGAAVVAAVLYFGGTLVLHGAMSGGALVSFMLYQQSLSGAFQALADVFSALAAALGAADKVIELIERKPKLEAQGTFVPERDDSGGGDKGAPERGWVPSPSGGRDAAGEGEAAEGREAVSPLALAGSAALAPVPLRSFRAAIELQNVFFSYPARPMVSVLNGFSLGVAPGEVVALVGPSGSGKSSVVKLVQRFYEPSRGEVLLDGRPISCYESQWLRKRVAFVSQEPVLYARSISRNIAYGMEAEDGVSPCEQASQADIETAARLANAHDFIAALPAGYSTECGDRGVQLSGGQKQRIAIARALLRRPAVLLLDEATSALDADSEAMVQEALERTMRRRTVLLIAHRLSTVQNAHRIAVVDRGAVVESGTHQALLASQGVYSLLVRRQTAVHRTFPEARGNPAAELADETAASLSDAAVPEGTGAAGRNGTHACAIPEQEKESLSPTPRAVGLGEEDIARKKAVNPFEDDTKHNFESP